MDLLESQINLVFVKAMPDKPKNNALMLKCCKILFQRLQIWRWFFVYGYGSIGAKNSVLSNGCFLVALTLRLR